MRRLTKRTRRSGVSQRGTAYVLVLAITTLLVTLGLASMQLAKNQIEHGESEHDLAQARLAAIYTHDYIHKYNNGSNTWREGFDSSVWHYLTELDGVRIWYNYVDPIDGDVTDDYSDPFVLHTLAMSGQTFRLYSAEYTVDVDGNFTRDASTFQQQVFSK